MLHHCYSAGSLAKAGSLVALVGFGALVSSDTGSSRPPASPRAVPFEQGPGVIASSLMEGLRDSGAQRVAVLDFDSKSGEPDLLGSWFADQLLVHLIGNKTRPRLVEREHLVLALAEQELLGTGLMDSQSAARAGHLLGADTVVAGYFTDAHPSLMVQARAISTDTGEILAMASIQSDLATVPEPLLAPPSDGGKAAYARTAVHRVQSSWQVGPLRVDIFSVRRQLDRKRATVDLRLINTSGEEIRLGIRRISFGKCSITLTDEQGTSHLPLGDDRGSGMIACVAKTSTKGDYTILPPGTTSAEMTFKAKQDAWIEGRRFRMAISFVLLSGEDVLRYKAGFENLHLTE